MSVIEPEIFKDGLATLASGSALLVGAVAVFNVDGSFYAT
jgi:hypothetical protein